MYWEYYVMGVILIPGLILAIIAQAKVSFNYKKYSQVISKNNMKACDVARLILDSAGLKQVQIKKINGELTDNYDPKAQTVSLSSSVYDSTSVAAIGVACHEVGHALQYAQNYAPVKIRMFLVRACNISSTLLWPLVIIGLILNIGLNSVAGMVCMWCGVIIFGLSVIFNLVTLPVEYNASNRAKSILSNAQILDSEEMEGVHKVLNAAALTYVAALVVSILNLLRFIIVMKHND